MNSTFNKGKLYEQFIYFEKINNTLKKENLVKCNMNSTCFNKGKLHEPFITC